jgi:serine/threonine-protein kinase RsbW
VQFERRKKMKTLRVPAEVAQLETVNRFIGEELEQYGCSMKIQMQVELAVEEIFVNIANYAYHPDVGEAEINVDASGEPPTITIQFLDRGTPFNPLEHSDVDVTLAAESRDIGGLGILLVKKSMDDVVYSYESGKNILTIRKKL